MKAFIRLFQYQKGAIKTVIDPDSIEFDYRIFQYQKGAIKTKDRLLK